MKNKFDLLLKKVSIEMKANNFFKNGLYYYQKEEGNIGLINFQKNRYSSASKTLFTINLGIWSKKISLFWEHSEVNKPIINDCHWKCRIGELLPVLQDWWEITEETNIEELSNEVISMIVDIAIPLIKKNISDSGLEENWFKHDLTGVSNTDRYLYLSALMKIYGHTGLSNIMEEFKEYCNKIGYQSVYQMHLGRIIAWSA